MKPPETGGDGRRCSRAAHGRNHTARSVRESASRSGVPADNDAARHGAVRARLDDLSAHQAAPTGAPRPTVDSFGSCTRPVEPGSMPQSSGRRKTVAVDDAAGTRVQPARLDICGHGIGHRTQSEGRPDMTAAKRARVAVNGYGVIGKRVADAVAIQEDMDLVGVADVTRDYRIRVAAERGYPIYASSPDARPNMK